MEGRCSSFLPPTFDLPAQLNRVPFQGVQPGCPPSSIFSRLLSSILRPLSSILFPPSCNLRVSHSYLLIYGRPARPPKKRPSLPVKIVSPRSTRMIGTRHSLQHIKQSFGLIHLAQCNQTGSKKAKPFSIIPFRNKSYLSEINRKTFKELNPDKT